MDYQSLNHTQWECKYHVTFIRSAAGKSFTGRFDETSGTSFRRLAEQKESKVCEGHLVIDHVHMMLSIPPKYAVSYVVGYIKGKSAIHIARTYGERRRNFVGQHFWARGFFVSTVGRDEGTIRN